MTSDPVTEREPLEGTVVGSVPLTGAQRAKRYRQRQRERREAERRELAARQARGYSWSPFEAGNTAAVRHGINSERTLLPRAERILETHRADSSWPPYLNDPSYAASVRAWARAEAACDLFGDYVSQLTIEDWIAETISTEEDEERAGGHASRKATSRKIGSALEQWRKLESHASAMRTRLGLDPLSRARLGKDISGRQADLAAIMAALDAEERESA